MSELDAVPGNESDEYEGLYTDDGDDTGEEGGPLLSVDLSSRDITKLSTMLDEARIEVETAKKLVTDAEKKKFAIEMRLWEELQEAGQDSFKRSDGVLWTRSERVYPKVADAEALMQALKEEGILDVMTKVEFRKDRLGEVIRKSFKTGEKLPEGLSFTATRYMSRRQGNTSTRYPGAQLKGDGDGEVFEIG